MWTCRTSTSACCRAEAVEGLDHLILKPKQLDGVTAVYVDVVFGHLAMALSKKS
jgi:hypothetical protein